MPARLKMLLAAATEVGGDFPCYVHISEKVAGGVVSRVLCVTFILVEA